MEIGLHLGAFFHHFVSIQTNCTVEAKYVGSSFCIKTVLPNNDSTDARPTIVKRIDEKIITIFSGKITTCVEAANQVQNLIKNVNN